MANKKADFLKFSVYSAILFLLSLLFSVFLEKAYVSQVIWAIVPFFFIMGVISRSVVYRYAQKNPRNFSNAYMLLTLSRLVFYVLIMVVYAYIFRDDAYPFMITFFIFYVAFTVYEMLGFYKSMHL